MTYNPARVVNNHFKERGILLDYETEIFINKLLLDIKSVNKFSMKYFAFGLSSCLAIWVFCHSFKFA